jgi:hypothetical protein
MNSLHSKLLPEPIDFIFIVVGIVVVIAGYITIHG